MMEEARPPKGRTHFVPSKSGLGSHLSPPDRIITFSYENIIHILAIFEAKKRKSKGFKVFFTQW